MLSECRSTLVCDTKNMEVSPMKKTSDSWLFAGVMTANDLCVNLLSSSLPSRAQTLQ